MVVEKVGETVEMRVAASVDYSVGAMAVQTAARSAEKKVDAMVEKTVAMMDALWVGCLAAQ